MGLASLEDHMEGRGKRSKRWRREGGECPDAGEGYATASISHGATTQTVIGDRAPLHVDSRHRVGESLEHATSGSELEDDSWWGESRRAGPKGRIGNAGAVGRREVRGARGPAEGIEPPDVSIQVDNAQDSPAASFQVKPGPRGPSAPLHA